MHRITQMKLDESAFIDYTDYVIIDRFKYLVDEYNKMLQDDTVSKTELAEKYLTVLYSCPAGFKLTARMTTNYRQLKTIYAQRKNHRLPEWREFCKILEELPHSEWITGK